MTREEAINVIKEHIDTYITCHGEEDTVAVSLDNVDVEAFDMAIKALEQEPCEDEYIKVPKKALKYRTAGMVTYNVEWLKNHFNIEQAVICGQQPCEDAISRQAVLDVIEQLDIPEDMCVFEILSHIELAIGTLPSVTPQQKTGQWIIKDGKEQGYDIAGVKTWYIQIMCDKCGFIKTAIEGHIGEYKFCPKCGQPKMQEVEE